MTDRSVRRGAARLVRTALLKLAIRFEPGRVRIAYLFRDDVTIGNGVVSPPVRLGVDGAANGAGWSQVVPFPV